MNPRRLVYLSTARLPTEKAHGYQIMRMCEAFAEQGLEVTLLHPSRVQTDEALEVSPFAYYGIPETFQLETLSGVDSLHFCNQYAPRFISIGARLREMGHTLQTLLSKHRAWRDPQTLLYSRDLLTSLSLCNLKNFVRAPLFFEAHRFPDRFQTPIMKAFSRLDRLVVVTEHLKRLFAKRLQGLELKAQKPKSEKHICVAPDAVDLKRFSVTDSREVCRRRCNLPAGKNIVGYVGRFSALGVEKGVSDLIESLALLRNNENLRDSLLLCVGGPMDIVSEYRVQAQSLGLPSEAVVFVDKVPNQEVPYWIKSCDVVTIPWRENTFSMYYTSPMKMFEYLAVGVPIVASRLPALEEVLVDGDNARLCEPGNVASLTSALKHVLLSSAQSTELAARGQQHVQAYSWERRAEKILMNV